MQEFGICRSDTVPAADAEIDGKTVWLVEAAFGEFVPGFGATDFRVEFVLACSVQWVSVVVLSNANYGNVGAGFAVTLHGENHARYGTAFVDDLLD